MTAENDPTPSDSSLPPGAVPPESGTAKPTPPPRRGKGRLILKVLAALVVIVVLLVALAPTLIGSAPVVSIITSEVNKQLNGKIEIESLSLGWFTGVDIKGVRVFDAGSARIAGLEHAAIPLPLWKAVTGNYSLGNVIVDGLTFDARLDSDGHSNFEKLLKSSPVQPTTAPQTASTESKPSRLPNVSADIKLTNCHGTVSQTGKTTIYLTKLDGEVKIPDINQPITDTLTAVVKVGEQPEGQINVGGAASAIKANQIAIDTAEIHQTVDVQNLALAAAKPFVPADMLDTLDGVLGAHVALDFTNGKTAILDASITAKQKISLGGKVLKGDTFSTNVFTITVPKLSADFPDGAANWKTARIKVGTDPGSSPILLQTDQGQLTIVVDAVPQAILNLIANQKPGSTGQLQLVDHFDLGAVARQLPHLVKTPQGVSITNGTLAQNINADWVPDKATLSKFTADITDVKGQRTVTGGTPIALSIEPIHVDIEGKMLAGLSDMPDLRDLKLSLQSKFANADFQGTSLADLNGKLHADLQALKSELSQFADLGGITLGGNVDVDITGNGTLTAPPHQAAIAVDVTAHDLQYATKDGSRLDEPLVHLSINGTLQVDDAQTPQSLKDVKITLQTGDAGAPTVDLLLTAGTISLVNGISADFNLQHLTGDLAKLQKELADVPAGKPGLIVSHGILAANAEGIYSPSKITVKTFSAGINDLTVSKQLNDGTQVSAIASESVKLGLAVDVDQTPASDGGTNRTVHLRTLTVADTANILDVHKVSDDFVITQTSAGGIGGSGKISTMAQLGSLNHILDVLGQTDVAVKTSSGDLRGGQLTGAIELAAVGPGKTAVNGNFDIADAVITTPTGTLSPQSATITLKAAADMTSNSIAVDQASLKTPFMTAALSNVNVSLAAHSVLDYVKSADLQVDVTDLKQTMALKDAFAVQAPAPTVVTPAKPAAADNTSKPLVIDSGSLFLQGHLIRDGSTLKLTAPSVTAKDIAFHRGTISYTAKPVAIKLDVAIDIANGKTLMDQISDVQLTDLSGDLGIATLSMPAPIIITQISASPQANGGVKLIGNLTDLTAFLAAFQGQKSDAYPYRGDYTLTENITSKQSAIALQGGIDVAKFQAYNGNTITFSEDLVSAVNDLSYVTTADNDADVNIASLNVSMKSSGALNVALTNASVRKLNTDRILQLQPKLDYDLAKLWPIIQPILGDGYKTLKITGHFQKQFNVTGSYPANQPMTTAIKTVKADGDLAVESFDYDGLSLQNLIVPITLADGKAVTVYAGKPEGQNMAAPAIANEGTLDIGNLTVDLTQDPPRLTTPPTKQMISKLTINPLFAGTFLKNIINNPLFSGANSATGLVDLTIADCTELPLGNLVTLPSPQNTGKIDLLLSITRLNISVGSQDLAKYLGNGNFDADVNDGTIAVAKGVSTQHIKFVTGSYTLSFDGNVRLKDEAFTPMTLGFPLKVIATKTHLVKDQRVTNSLPDEISVPVEGTVNAPKFRFDKVIGKVIKDATGKAIKGGLLNELLKQRKE